MRPETRRWWTQALEDMKTARVNERTGRYYASVFFCQQAAEKALKALYIHHKRRPQPKTHNLMELGRELGVPSFVHERLAELNPEFVVTHYPDAANGVPAEMYTARRARRFLKSAEEVIRWVDRKLGTPSSGRRSDG